MQHIRSVRLPTGRLFSTPSSSNPHPSPSAAQHSKSTPAPSSASSSPGEFLYADAVPRVPATRHSTYHEEFDSMLRVDHAGEYGAVRIYEGQIAVLGNSPIGNQLKEMREHEQVHLDNLQRVMPARRVRPTALLPFWHVAGFALGAVTAAMGPRAAMACTVAVEEVITEHYNNQLRSLHQRPESKEIEALRQMIVKHRDDEMEHREIGIRNEAENAPFYSALSSTIKAGCHAAIWLAQRI